MTIKNSLLRGPWPRLVLVTAFAGSLAGCPDDEDPPADTGTGDTGGDMVGDMAGDTGGDMGGDMTPDMEADGTPDMAEETGPDATEETGPDAGGPGTIVEVAVAAGSFTTLAAALTEADLIDTLNGAGPFTVFAPTDAAFAAIGLNADNIDTVEGLADILTYHVLPLEAPESVVATLDGEGVATVNGIKVYVSITEDGVFLNDLGETAVGVEDTDIEASNGVIHVIDAVLIPPTIPEVAILEGAFDTLVAGVVAAELDGVLAGDNEGEGFTVLAPTDDAFSALEIDAENIGDIEGLDSVLLYHVVPGTALAADVAAAELLASALVLDPDDGDEYAAPLVVSTDGGVFVNGVEVQVTDVLAANGVIHVIDGVLLPDDAPEVATANDLDTVVAAAVEADLAAALSAPNGPFTLLVPTEAAFGAALTALDTLCDGTFDSLDDIDANLGDGTLAAVLTLHVIPGTAETPFLGASTVAAAAGEGATVDTLAGADTLTLGVDGETITVAAAGSTANVVATNIASTNAIIHLIDTVLLPDLSTACPE